MLKKNFTKSKIKSRRKKNPTNSEINQSKIDKIIKLAEKYGLDVQYDNYGQLIMYTGVYDREHPNYDPDAEY